MRKSYAWLRPWPLLIAGVAAFLGAIRLLLNTTSLEAVGFSLVAIGAVCLGAWIALLASHDYAGQEAPTNADSDVVDPAGTRASSTPEE
jgi:hypothetical protein